MSKVILALYAVITSLALIVLKLGAKSGAVVEHVNNKISFNINTYTLVGVFFYGVSFLLYVYLISRYDLGYIIPVAAAFVYILIFTASYFIFHETFTVIKVAGIVLIVGGLVLLNVNK